MYDPHKPFGSDIKNKVDFGSKYEFKLDSNPPPGFYQPNFDVTKPHAPSATINPEEIPKRPQEPTPDGGSYDPHKPFGADLKNVDFGSKYEFKMC